MYNFTEEVIVENNESLKILIDFNTKKDVLNSIKYTGNLTNNYLKSISRLEIILNNVPLKSILKILEVDSQINAQFPDMPFLLFVKWYKNILGVVTLRESQNLICNCYGITKEDLKLELDQNQMPSYGEIVAKTKATISCGNCTKTLKNEYRKTCKSLFKLKVNNTFFDQHGDWISFKNLTPAELILGINELKNEWCQKNQYLPSDIEILKASGLHFSIKLSENIQDPIDVIDSMEQFLFERSGLLIFLIN